MNRRSSKAIIVLAVAMVVAVAAFAAKPPDCWMTGGGSVFNPDGQEVLYTGRATHGFVVHCDPRNSDSLQVNWAGNRFHMTDLETALCPNDPAIDPDPPEAEFDTFIGTGTGRYNGQRGFCIAFTLTDTGQPGVEDTASIVITDCRPESDNETILMVSGPLTFGNHQAHSN